jgi:hypothetical protein
VKKFGLLRSNLTGNQQTPRQATDYSLLALRRGHLLVLWLKTDIQAMRHEGKAMEEYVGACGGSHGDRRAQSRYRTLILARQRQHLFERR